jgi:hypothetical protein
LYDIAASVGSLFSSKEDPIVSKTVKKKRPAESLHVRYMGVDSRIAEIRGHIVKMCAAIDDIEARHKEHGEVPDEHLSWLNSFIDNLDDTMYHHKLISVKKPPSHGVIVKKRTEYYDRRWKKRMAMLTKSLNTMSRKIKSAFDNFPPEIESRLTALESTVPDIDNSDD